MARKNLLSKEEITQHEVLIEDLSSQLQRKLSPERAAELERHILCLRRALQENEQTKVE